MTEEKNEYDALGVVDSQGYFWKYKDKMPRGFWESTSQKGTSYATIPDLEYGEGPVTPVFAANTDLAQARLVELHKAQAEILRLETLYGAKVEGIACECTQITPGSHISPPEYEQNPWCPVHPDVNQIRAEFARLKDLLDKADTLILAQRKVAEAEHKYSEEYIAGLKVRDAYESALKEVRE